MVRTSHVLVALLAACGGRTPLDDLSSRDGGGAPGQGGGEDGGGPPGVSMSCALAASRSIDAAEHPSFRQRAPSLFEHRGAMQLAFGWGDEAEASLTIGHLSFDPWSSWSSEPLGAPQRVDHPAVDIAGFVTGATGLGDYVILYKARDDSGLSVGLYLNAMDGGTSYWLSGGEDETRAFAIVPGAGEDTFLAYESVRFGGDDPETPISVLHLDRMFHDWFEPRSCVQARHQLGAIHEGIWWQVVLTRPASWPPPNPDEYYCEGSGGVDHVTLARLGPNSGFLEDFDIPIQPTFMKLLPRNQGLSGEELSDVWLAFREDSAALRVMPLTPFQGPGSELSGWTIPVDSSFVIEAWGRGGLATAWLDAGALSLHVSDRDGVARGDASIALEGNVLSSELSLVASEDGRFIVAYAVDAGAGREELRVARLECNVSPP